MPDPHNMSDHDLLVTIHAKLESWEQWRSGIDESQTKQDDRIRSLELWRAMLAGALILLVTLIGWVVTLLPR